MLPIFPTAGTVTSDAPDDLLGVVLLSWRVDDLLARLAHGALDGTLRGDHVELRDARDDRIWLPLVADADRQGARSGDFRATARLEVAGRALRFGAAPGPRILGAEQDPSLDPARSAGVVGTHAGDDGPGLSGRRGSGSRKRSAACS